VVDLAPDAPVQEGRWLPDFTATLRASDEKGQIPGKWQLVVGIGGLRGAADGTIAIDKAPLRAIGVTTDADGTTYTLGLDDARPWRVSVVPRAGGAMRMYVDVGGHPQALNASVAVYEPPPGAAGSGSSVAIGGAARVFEANVVWRIKDLGGKELARGNTTASLGTSPVWGVFQTTAPIPPGVTGQVTLEVFWASPKDGTDQDVVQIPLTVR